MLTFSCGQDALLLVTNSNVLVYCKLHASDVQNVRSFFYLFLRLFLVDGYPSCDFIQHFVFQIIKCEAIGLLPR